MYVTEYDYDDEIGRIVEQRELRDVATKVDSLIHSYEYSPWNATLGGAQLIHETTTDRPALPIASKTYRDIGYEDFEQGQWRRRVEKDTLTGTARSESRTFTNRGELKTTTDPLGLETTYAYADCGVRTRTTDPIGYVESTVLDARPTQVLKKFDAANLAKTDIVYDRYGRQTSRTTDPAVGAGDAVPAMVEQFAYDTASPAGRPASVTIQPEPDGSLTLEKVYVDGHGRTLKTVRCAGSGTGGSGDLDAQYPCLSGTEVITEILYDPSTGDQSEITWLYLIADAVAKRPVRILDYDVFGRVVTAQEADGTSLQYSYSLGSRSVTDPIGRKTTVTFDTLAEDVTVAGSLPAVYRGGTVRNAFGLVTAIYDADKNQSNISYDGFNRKRQELLPAADILPSGAASATFERPSISYTYDNGDRLLSRTDANGQPTTFEYDSKGKGRLSTTKGPDGLVVERRTYVEGGYGTRKVTVSDSRLGVNREEHLDGLGRVWKQVAFDGT